jgi:hypothetical protein
MSLRRFLAFLVLTTGLVWAQGSGGGVTTGTTGAFISGPRGPQGVPYSADVISELTRILADGNRIHQETHGKQFRDSEGRTRSETELPMMVPQQAPIQHISIVDPVQGVFINLDSRTKTATIHHMTLPATQAGQPNSLPGSPVARTQTAVPAHVESYEHLRPEDLGTMEIEGFTAKGTKYTHTIPAGRIGNEQPITSVQETWASPVLKIVLLNKHDDPQSGQRTMKLTNIRTAEPDPSLFQVPPDYTIKEDGSQK